jgi:hypothetical protein
MQTDKIKLTDIQTDYQQMYSDMREFEEAAITLT